MMKNLFRINPPLLGVLVFLAAAWCFAEWKYNIADVCSVLLLRANEAPRFSRKNFSADEFQPKVTLPFTGTIQGKSRAGEVISSEVGDQGAPRLKKNSGSGRFITDSCLRDWAVSGLFTSPMGGKSFNARSALSFDFSENDAKTGCKSAIVLPGANWRILQFTETNGNLSLDRAFPERRKTAPSAVFMETVIAADRDYPNARLLVSHDGSLKAFLDGKEIYDSKHPRFFRDNSDFTVDIPLRKGENILLLKGACSAEFWTLRLRIVDYDGEPIFLSPDSVSVPESKSQN